MTGNFHNFELYSFSPLFQTGYALVGEMSKFTRVSPVRVNQIMSSIVNNVPHISFLVYGAADEIVTVTIVVPSSSSQDPTNLSESQITNVQVSFSSSGGTSLVTCSGYAPASCQVS